MQVQIISKSAWTNQLVDKPQAGIELGEDSVVLVDIDPAQIKTIEYVGNTVVITLKNGDVIKIENFVAEESSLVFRTQHEQFFYYDLAKVEYVSLDQLEPLLYSKSEFAAFPYLWPILTGLGIAAFAGIANSNSDTKQPQAPDNHPDIDPAPQLESAEVTVDGEVLLTFDEALDPVNPPRLEDLTLTVDGEAVEIDKIIIDGNQVTLVPATPIEKDQTVNVKYDDPTNGNDPSALQDEAGNDVASFDVAVTNPLAPALETAAVTVDGEVLLTFDEALDPANPPRLEDLTLTVDGEAVEIDKIIIDGNQVTLVPATPIEKDQTVNVK
ncbi:BapA/Bap/LapF family prefix-like domain-containing protein, partial [Acinetobacter sp.]|uniref:BapA/Bap/LapF family prefix-like domain-containing protein n=1 Tax=Acinetobacter sp. TaxID=472 RepID=UPI00388D87EC